MQPTLGRRIKALRVSRDLSLKDVAAETGLSTSFLSKVETGANEMSVGRLVAVADFFEVGLGDLVPRRGVEQPVVLRRGDGRAVDFADGRVRSEALALPHDGQVTGEVVRFDAGAELSDGGSQAGPEFVLVLAGELTVELVDDTSLVLREGDSAWFEASRRRRQLNSGEGEAEIVTFRGAARPA
jgi:transcriptional regulator with XRE-family HTH domain